MAAGDIVRKAWQELEPEIAEQGYELIEVQFGRHGRGSLLRLFIDKDGGVTLDDCANVSQVVSAVLDKTDFVEGSYMLEVSSPGFDRPLRKPKDFERFTGEAIKLKTHEPVEGRKQFSGTLQGFRDGLVLVDCQGTQYEIHVENIQKANLDR